MTILYFTATGNNFYLAKKMGGNLISIPRAIKENNFHFKDDKIGIIFPIYGLAVPYYIREFLSKVQLDSKYVFAVMSYGMYNGAASSHLIKLASENGICFSYINTIKMVDNSLTNYEMGDQIKNEPKKEIDKHLDEIISDINNNKQWIPKDSFASRLLTKSLVNFKKFQTGVGITEQCNVEDTCIHCGICAKVCPTDNIQVNGAKPVFGRECISCLACTHNCPQNVIRLTHEKSKIRYRNKHVKLNEIVEANNAE